VQIIPPDIDEGEKIETVVETMEEIDILLAKSTKKIIKMGNAEWKNTGLFVIRYQDLLASNWIKPLDKTEKFISHNSKLKNKKVKFRTISNYLHEVKNWRYLTRKRKKRNI
jgi:hypothetical protein